MFNAKTLIAFTASLFVSSVAAEAVVASVQTSGSGCPGGNGLNTRVTAGTLVTLSNAPAFKVAMGGDGARKQKNCQATIAVNVGPNEQFSVLQSDWIGWAKLEPGATATVFPSFFFQSAPEKTFSLRKEFTGPDFVNGANFFVSGEEIKADLWSACGQPDAVIVQSRLALVGTGAAEAQGIVDPGQNIQIVTRAC